MMKKFVLILFAVSGASAMAVHENSPTVTGSYFAMIVSDIETSREWYVETFNLVEQTRRVEEGRYEIINLAKAGLFVELLELDDAGAHPGGRIQGPFKVGYLVDNIEVFVESLPVKLKESARIIHDEENKLLVLQLRDPDERIIQIMQRLSD